MGVSRVNPCNTPITPTIKPFPKLMTRDGAVALFLDSSHGTLLIAGNGSGWGACGTTNGSWDSCRWTDYNEVLCLKND